MQAAPHPRASHISLTQVIHVHYGKVPHHSLLDASANTGPLLSMHRGTWARGSVPRPGSSGSLAPLPLS